MSLKTTANCCSIARAALRRTIFTIQKFKIFFPASKCANRTDKSQLPYIFMTKLEIAQVLIKADDIIYYQSSSPDFDER